MNPRGGAAQSFDAENSIRLISIKSIPSARDQDLGRTFTGSSPTTIYGSTRRSLEYPTLRRSSSCSASKYNVVTSYNTKNRSPWGGGVGEARRRDLPR